MPNFWEKMKKPILCLAPMADVTDSAFRYVIAKNSKIPFVTYTEFVSADGLVLAPEKGKKKLLKDLEFNDIERPIVAQLFSSGPEMMEKAAQLVLELGFDGLDINMGCPDKSIEKQGAGAALMKNPKLAREIIVAAKRGVKGKITVSVKTRIGYNKDELETWLPELLAENPAAIIIHARTRKEMSKVPARWDRIKRAVEIRDFLNSKTLIIGNGDVKDIADAEEKCFETGADGAMLGRAIFGNPWLFANYEPTNEERLKVLLEHIKIFDEKFKGIKSFAIMKKHFKEYLKTPELTTSQELRGASRDLRFKLMRTETAKEAEDMLMDFNSN
ncbi:MAG: tRNA-dihydrouridine synthase family protein [Patescibacteria group bacterium]